MAPDFTGANIIWYLHRCKFLINWNLGKTYDTHNEYRCEIRSPRTLVQESELLAGIKRVVQETHPNKKDQSFNYAVQNIFTTIDDLWNTQQTKEQEDSSETDQTESPSTNHVS